MATIRRYDKFDVRNGKFSEGGQMKRLTLWLFVSLLSFSNLIAWDRYTNETETTLGTYGFQKIIHYNLNVSNAQTYTFETKDSNGDTYMYLWSDVDNRQVAKNDDGGIGFHSKITALLQVGTYKIFVRSYSSNASSTCDLYQNNSLVLSDVEFAGTQIDINTYDAETRFRTTNIGNSDTYMLLLNSSGNLIGYDDDGGNSIASSISASQKPSKLILGAYSSYSEGSCSLAITADNNLEFLALCGSEKRHAQSGNKFIGFFDSGSYYYEHVLQANKNIFINNSLNSQDAVDFMWIHTHGSSAFIQDFNDEGITFATDSINTGSGNILNGQSGDLEYIAFLTCQTVKIEEESSWTWLDTRGWRSHMSNADLRKGLFDGLHLVVGYHSNHSNLEDIDDNSWELEAKYFADNLDAGQSIWEAWKNSNKRATDKIQHWYVNSNADLGEISSIYIVPQKDESLNNFKSADYKIGDSSYYFGWRKYHYHY